MKPYVGKGLTKGFLVSGKIFDKGRWKIAPYRSDHTHTKWLAADARRQPAAPIPLTSAEGAKTAKRQKSPPPAIQKCLLTIQKTTAQPKSRRLRHGLRLGYSPASRVQLATSGRTLGGHRPPGLAPGAYSRFIQRYRT